jgi:DNA-binding CsgD family transcriptional regulator/DNA-binding Xre family transcriptional regulator
MARHGTREQTAQLRREIRRLKREGHSNRLIARVLGVDEHTVRYHLRTSIETSDASGTIRIIRRARQLLRACSCPACAKALALLDWLAICPTCGGLHIAVLVHLDDGEISKEAWSCRDCGRSGGPDPELVEQLSQGGSPRSWLRGDPKGGYMVVRGGVDLDQLEHALFVRGWTKQDLSRVSGLSRYTVARIWSKRQATVRTINRIKAALEANDPDPSLVKLVRRGG